MGMLIQTLINGVLRSGLYAITSLGLALCVGVLGLINFSHGELLMLGSFLGYFMFTGAGIDPLLTLPIAAVLLFALNALIYKAFISRTLDAPEMNRMLLTFGLSVIIQNLALILFRGDPRAITPVYRSITVSLGLISIGLGRIITYAVALIMVLAVYAILAKTRFGKAMRAVSQNREGAAMVGVNVDSIYMLAFGLAGALAGMAGVMLSAILYAHPFLGMEFTLKALSTVVLAGLGNVTGVLLASVLLGTAEAIVGTYVPSGSAIADAVFFILILLVLIFKPEGLSRR